MALQEYHLFLIVVQNTASTARCGINQKFTKVQLHSTQAEELFGGAQRAHRSLSAVRPRLKESITLTAASLTC